MGEQEPESRRVYVSQLRKGDVVLPTRMVVERIVTSERGLAPGMARVETTDGETREWKKSTRVRVIR